ncbi:MULTISPECIES: TetR/AcrR family transcriptional regulator [unclassified Streptomyces]|uniref:TetR/AcrR family transcriptional regulator n=1 Tax=unclassified Streptomyces TaxID=2593676 RepID=UPI002DD9FE0F|nr:TetR/AcrR family transcriptional regulator [Streptomyces sp. NBC_00243]WRZ18574.1 TetR/AcrR family transcriptional regulator [Streptomyces sp. NBC_00243]
MTAPFPAEGRARTRMEPEARRDQIIACARRAFGEKPYGAVSLADIAREAGVTRGLVNHYFGGKRELYLEVLREMVAVPDSVLERLPKGTLQERVNGVVDRFLSVVDRNRGMWLATVDALSHGHDPDVDAVMREAEEATVDQTLRALGIDPDTETDEPLRGMCRAFAAMTRSATNEWLNRGTLSREQTFALLERTLLLIITEFGPESRGE